MNVYEQLAEKEIVHAVNKHFYDQVYDHPWLSKYFQVVTKEHIIKQQTDFMVGALGGPKMFCGRLPSHAHPHMFINNELFDLRKSMLATSFEKLNVPEILKEAWFRIDEAFRGAIVKSSRDECKGRWKTDEIVDYITSE